MNCEFHMFSNDKGAATKAFVALFVILAIGAIGIVIVKRRNGKEYDKEGHTLIRPAMQHDEYEERDVQIT